MPSKQETTFKDIEELKKETVLPPTTTDESSTVESPTFSPPVEAQVPVQAPTARQPEDSKFVRQVKEVIINISQEHYNKIVEGLKKDILRFEYIDSSGNIKVDNKNYVPMTIGMNKKVGKVLKRERLVREEVRASLAKEEGALTIDQLKKKYSDIFDDDLDENDLKNEITVSEIIGNYSVAQKANIYWGIEDINNYTLNDLVMIIALYESRNGYNPSS